MARTVTIDGLADAIVKELQDYSQEVTDGLKADVKTVARECRDDIRKNAPRRTGEYAKGWKDKISFENKEDIRITIHNPTRYQIAHPLEYGHAKVGGGRVEARPHIRPAEEAAAAKLGKKVKVLVGKGG